MSFEQQTVASLTSSNGRIAVDEHSSLACLVHDVSATGLSLTVLDGAEVPVTFLLFVGSDTHVCHIVRRSDEQIDACFAATGPVARAANPLVRRQRVDFVRHATRSSCEEPMRRAA